MKDEDIKLPDMKILGTLEGKTWRDDIQEYARQAVRMNMPAAQPSDPEPFDLARAMAGEPIVTRDGRKARFVAHVPEAEDHKVVAFVEGQGVATSFCETGHIYSHNHEHGIDLLMAPKPKRTVWVNVWCLGGDVGGGVHASKEHAILAAENNGEYVHIAIPIEIDA